MFFFFMKKSIGPKFMVKHDAITGNGSSVGSVRFGEREVTGSIPGCDIPKSFEMVLAAPRFDSDLRGRARTGRPSVRII